MQTSCEKPRIGVGIDTGRHGHRATFLRPDRQHAAEPLDFGESSQGYEQLAAVIRRLQGQHADCQLHVHIDAAGQYAVNLERFARTLPGVMVSVGEPKRNKDYHAAISPKRKSDATESYAMARFAVAEAPAASPERAPQFLVLHEIAGRLKVKVVDCARAVNRLHNLLARVFPELASLIPNIASSWVLTLLEKYPTPRRIARARLESLTAIRHAPKLRIEPIQRAASQSVGGLEGEAVESLVKLAVGELRDVQRQRRELETLLEQAFGALPPSGHQQLATIPGVGLATAAVLVSKIVSIERFDAADKLVGYFGCFPRQHQSGVEKNGQPKPNKATRMSQQGCDLARGYLYAAAKTAARHNPAVRALYKRLRARGARGDVALGHCMRKLLHLAFAVWKTNRPFDPRHYRWEEPPEDSPAEPTPEQPPAPQQKKAAGRTRVVDSPRPAVTAASSNVAPAPDEVNSKPAELERPSAAPAAPPPNQEPNDSPRRIDYQALRSRISLEQILRHLDLLPALRSTGGELRGPCPIHQADPQGKRHRTFAANLGKNVFHCFHPGCEAQGNQLDFWALFHQQTIHQAAEDIIQTFNLSTTATEKRSP